MRTRSERPHTLARVSVAPEVTGARGPPAYSGSLYRVSSAAGRILSGRSLLFSLLLPCLPSSPSSPFPSLPPSCPAFLIFAIALLTYSPHTLKITPLKCLTQWVLVVMGVRKLHCYLIVGRLITAAGTPQPRAVAPLSPTPQPQQPLMHFLSLWICLFLAVSFHVSDLMRTAVFMCKGGTMVPLCRAPVRIKDPKSPFCDQPSQVHRGG